MAREPVWFWCCSVHFTAIIRSHSRRSGRTPGEDLSANCFQKVIKRNIAATLSERLGFCCVLGRRIPVDVL